MLKKFCTPILVLVMVIVLTGCSGDKKTGEFIKYESQFDKYMAEQTKTKSNPMPVRQEKGFVFDEEPTNEN